MDHAGFRSFFMVRPFPGRKRWSWYGVSLAVMLWCGMSPVPVHAQEVSQRVDGFSLEGFNENGDRAWDVSGDNADLQGDTITISNVDANAYGQQEVNLKARRGQVDKKSGNVYLQEDVVITTADGRQLKTDSLDWAKHESVVRTEDEAEIIQETIQAKGVGLTARPELNTAQLDRDVVIKAQAQDLSAEKQEIVIKCDGPMELDQQQNMATLRENVVAVRGDQVLKADKVEVRFSPETKKIETIICIDNVSVQRGDNISYADKAIYSAADQKVIFVGRPKLIMTTEDGDASFF